MLRNRIITWIFFPYIVQSIFCIYFFSQMLNEENDQTDFLSNIAKWAIVLLSLYFLYIYWQQIAQIYSTGDLGNVYQYLFVQYANLIEISSQAINLILILNDWTNRHFMQAKSLKYIVMISVTLIWIRALQWMKLFDEPA